MGSNFNFRRGDYVIFIPRLQTIYELCDYFIFINQGYFTFLFILQCWNQCTTTTDPIDGIDDDDDDGGDSSNTMYDEWPLNIESMIRDGYLVTTIVTWPKQIPPISCLVTWEVLGGGLMGSLFTETSDVELSLWPDTQYNVQVTCKNKVS